MTPLVAALVLAPVPTPEGQWGPTSLTATALARRVDLRLATLAHTVLSFRWNYDRPMGAGYADCSGTIVSPKVFRLEVPIVNEVKPLPMPFERYTWISDGKHFGAGATADAAKPGPMTKRPTGPAHPASAWFLNFSNVILSGVGQATHPFERFVTEAGAFGLKTVIETRKLTYKGQHLVFYRLVMTKPKTRYEVVFDGRGFLPVTVTNTVGPRDNTRWSAVKWDPSKKNGLDPSKAKFRPKGVVLPLSPAPRRH